MRSHPPRMKICLHKEKGHKSADSDMHQTLTYFQLWFKAPLSQLTAEDNSQLEADLLLRRICAEAMHVLTCLWSQLLHLLLMHAILFLFFHFWISGDSLFYHREVIGFSFQLCSVKVTPALPKISRINSLQIPRTVGTYCPWGLSLWFKFYELESGCRLLKLSVRHVQCDYICQLRTTWSWIGMYQYQYREGYQVWFCARAIVLVKLVQCSLPCGVHVQLKSGEGGEGKADF